VQRVVAVRPNIKEDVMERPVLTHESRCLLIVAGSVIEYNVEDRARAIAASRSAKEITPDDVRKAMEEFFHEQLSDLPRLVQQAVNKFRCPQDKAA
jgi:hypothetical protein